jgi:hypothetical protein
MIAILSLPMMEVDVKYLPRVESSAEGVLRRGKERHARKKVGNGLKD